MSSYLKGIANRVNGVDKKSFTKELDIDSLVPSKNNFYGIREIEELAASIKENGLMHNLVVRDIGNGTYEIISGERRYTALKKLGYEKVPCQIREINDLDAELMLIHANLEQRELTPTEKMEGIKRLENIYKQKRKNGEKLEGKTRDLIGKDLGLSGVQVGRYKKVDKDLIPELKEKLDKEDITLTQAHTLSSLTKEEQKAIHDEIKDLNTKEHKLEVDILVQGIKQPIERKEDQELLDEMYSKSKSKQDIVMHTSAKIADEKENNIEHKEKYIGTIREQIAKITEYDPHPTIVISDDKIKAFFYKVEQITILEKEIQAVSKGSVLNLYTRNIIETNKIPDINETLFKMSAYGLNEGVYLYFENYNHEMKFLTKRGLVEIDDNI
ncbi:ParB/RepB/Spo0J family partition protein [Clostridium botulinum]|uniref:ParB/RepB/Spo0J family partition protein n=1 Tax=Clostridium botulinum TaxID=1491 RepID=A0A6B4JJ85_CLOBO|nr:ParB N-terminal domain-containing protein [Clostridium botulinum]EES47810.1 ParB protein [Clostridium botulinum E1 str. 'BoNT E Beluga']MBY6760555.1 ParB N-terminal domain-containing protein [Clostridium botulinum]MBY6919462.1 ParB N-terminal domain-containing protein [Clostridium botulinum]MCR1130340.1 ParB/RepB/Spo0J family partition protein [Clostridium botulinum]NFJ56902.1 ParB/RepB/Spo0J family partition protein [Clostridium botulinum]